jgi:hypothetical protein
MPQTLNEFIVRRSLRLPLLNPLDALAIAQSHCLKISVLFQFESSLILTVALARCLRPSVHRTVSTVWYGQQERNRFETVRKFHFARLPPG